MNERSAHNITATDSLTTRLDFNRRHAKFDFHAWVKEHYAFSEGEHVLDVGCGTGAQALTALAAVGPIGSVSALDISADSIAALRRSAGGAPNLTAVVATMDQLEGVIAERFPVKIYDVAHSTYALWYAQNHIGALDAMRAALRPRGRLIVTTPNAPNGLRELAKRVGPPTPYLDLSTRFGPNVLEPYFRSYFARVTIHLQRNTLVVTDVDEVVRFYRAAAYYDRETEPRLRSAVTSEIAATGRFLFEKNNYMIIGQEPGDD
jgi:SAM-dependent methyltransferase